MPDWLNEVEALTQKGQIAVPYKWWVGEVGSRFLSSLRDEKKITANRCGKCGTVYIPPRKNCGKCFVDITEWLDLGHEGTVQAFTIVRFNYKLHPVQAPFAYALIRIDGTDVDFLHIIKEKLDLLKNGCRVRAKFREQRTGHIMDIDSFEIIR